jgi:hypothetical protein
MSGEIEELADRLDEIAEAIADLAIDAIRGALRAGATSRPADERKLTQARRAVEKASHLLRGLETGPDPADD